MMSNIAPLSNHGHSSPAPIIITKSKASWSRERACWRLDIAYLNSEGQPKRTFRQVPGSDDPNDSHSARRAAKDFMRGIGPLYTAFIAQHQSGRSSQTVAPARVTVRARAGQQLTVSWLLESCLSHPEVWGAVKHPKNYRSGVNKLTALVGERLVSEFEPPHGRKIIVEVVNALRCEGHSDGYVRKIAYQLRQALSAAIGQGVSEPIGDPETGEQLIRDIPTFPYLPKSKGRTAVLEKRDDEIVFKVIGGRFLRARDEEKAFAIKVNRQHELGIGARGRVEIGGQVVWLNPKRFTSGQWRIFRDYISFLIETGCRRSEALSVGNHSLREREVLRADGSVEETYKVLHLPGEVTKNGDDRFINLTPKMLNLIKMLEAFAQPHTFQIGTRTIHRDRAWFPLQPNQVTAMWEHVREDAKRFGLDLSAISPHQLRHTHATRMSARGMSGKPLQEHLGHRDDRTTRIYDHAQQVENSRPFYKRNVGG